jgi:hypothetical protein
MAALLRVGYAGNPVRFRTSAAAEVEVKVEVDAANAVAVKIVQVQNREGPIELESAVRRKS